MRHYQTPLCFRKIAIWLFALCGYMAWLSACSEVSPEDEIRALVAEALEAAQVRDTGHFRGLIAPEFVTGNGIDRARMIDIIRGFFLTNPRVTARADWVSLELVGTDSADIVLDLDIRGAASGYDGRVEIELFRDGFYWQIAGATRQAVPQR